ncbi:hypothetical protein Tco_1432716 [Tanacetum coccineum]
MSCLYKEAQAKTYNLPSSCINRAVCLSSLDFSLKMICANFLVSTGSILNSLPADNVPAGRSSSIPADYVSAGHVLVPADSDRIC